MSACFRGYLTKGQKDDAYVERIKMVKALLKHGADASYVTPQNDTRMTAMHWACYNKDRDVVRALLEANAD